MLSQFVLLPLYIYPGTGAWQKLYDVIPSNPNLPFYVVINPSDGPGVNTYQDVNWANNIALLNSYPNVKTLGYVHTSTATRNINDTLADIDTYAFNWTSHNKRLQMDGIFFDEAPSTFDTATSTYMGTVSTHAKTVLGTGRDYIVFNAGAHSPLVLDKGFYAMADTIIVFEDYAANFKAADVQKISSALRPQSAFIVHDYSGNVAGQTAIVNALVNYGVAGVYVTDSTSYSLWGSMWSSFVAAMTSAFFNSKTSVGNTASSNVGTVTGNSKRLVPFVA